MVLVIDKCAGILTCDRKQLRRKLKHPENREMVLKELYGRKVRTTYTDRNGFKKEFFIAGLSEQSAAQTMAFGNLKGPSNGNICQYFLMHHGIKLKFEYLNCIIERFPKGEDR
jgi:hypothetical protein